MSENREKAITDCSLYPMEWYCRLLLLVDTCPVLLEWNRGLANGRADPRLPGEIWDNILGRLLDGPNQTIAFLSLSFFCAHQGVGVCIIAAHVISSSRLPIRVPFKL